MGAGGGGGGGGGEGEKQQQQLPLLLLLLKQSGQASDSEIFISSRNDIPGNFSHLQSGKESW